MDTNQKQQNNLAVNTFTGGMNSDTSYDMISNELYLFSKNIRITNNTLLNALSKANTTEGVVTQVEEGEAVQLENSWDESDNIERILAVQTIDNIGAIIVRNSDKKWVLYKIELSNRYGIDVITFSKLFTSVKQTEQDTFSTVINKEVCDVNENEGTEKNVVKLYVATGIDPILQININDSEYINNIKDESDFSNCHRFPKNQVQFLDLINGNLKTSLVQYTYRLYKKYGICSKLAPITNKMQVISGSRALENGNASDTNTSRGFKLGVSVDEQMCTLFDHIQVFRLQYIKAGENAKISLIYDSKFQPNVDEDGNPIESTIIVYDTGSLTLAQLSIDQLASLNTLTVIPKEIELNQNRLFAANVKDESIFTIDNSKYDTRAFGFNTDYKTVLYPNNKYDTNDSIEYDLSVLKEQTEILNGITRYSDCNQDTESLPEADKCAYAPESNIFYYGGVGKNISWKFVVAGIGIHDRMQDHNPTAPHTETVHNDIALSKITKQFGVGTGLDITQKNSGNSYLYSHNIYLPVTFQYANYVTSSMFRSLRRDEVYRYGIIFYNEFGNRSDVQWIADIKTPSVKDIPLCAIDADPNDQSVNVLNRINTRTVTTGADLIIEYGITLNNYNTQFRIYRLLSADRGWWDHGDIEFEGDHPSKYWYYNIKIIPDNPGHTVTSEDGNEEFTIPAGMEWRISKLVWIEWNGNRYSDREAAYYDVNSHKYHVMKEGPLCGLLTDFDTYISVDDGEYLPMWSEFRTALLETKIKIRVDGVKLTAWNNPASNVTLKEHTVYREFTPKVSFLILYRKPTDENKVDSYDVKALALGLQFKVRLPTYEEVGLNIIGYQIVRCAKDVNTTKNLLLCAISRPIRQEIYNKIDNGSQRYSPYYPTPFLTNLFLRIILGYGILNWKDPENIKDSELFQIFSPDILYRRNDTLSTLMQDNIKLHPLCLLYGQSITQYNNLIKEVSDDALIYYTYDNIFRFGFNKHLTKLYRDDKPYRLFVFCDYRQQYPIYGVNESAETLSCTPIQIKLILDVLNPTWEQGFSNVSITGSELIGSKLYKSFVTNVGSYNYLNWICNGMYDLRLSANTSQDGVTNTKTKVFTYATDENTSGRTEAASGWIGPGPVCFVAQLATNTDTSHVLNRTTLNIPTGDSRYALMSTLLCNITHPVNQYSGFTQQEKQYDVYYGFGNYYFGPSGTEYTLFDGDTYITPAEFITMYKTYNFQSLYDTLQSSLVTYYVPIESKFNSFFDYGKSHKNTNSANVLLEPGEITGIATQDRPAYQMNLIYSDNNFSNDIYSMLPLEETASIYPQRILYSELKQNGEYIDNYTLFKATNFIDADSRYGEITNLLTAKDIIYYWLNTAFGKLSVNERSLIKDQNDNTIQLGQGGVLQRTDYIDTRYGMRSGDRSAISANNAVYWIDILNNAIVNYRDNQVINYSEMTNVLNILNYSMSNDVPTIHYDIQNYELLCKCLKDNEQLIFNLKLNRATSIYNRKYDDLVYFNNVLYTLHTRYNDSNRINYVSQKQGMLYLSPVQLSFVVNSNPSVTKTFDNQNVVIINSSSEFKKEYKFETNIQSEFTVNDIKVGDREGNIEYCIPRYNNSNFGDRLRGKWLKVTISDNTARLISPISHVLTKFRQSYS